MSIKKHIIYFQALFFVIVLEASTAFSQVVVDGTKTTQQLVQDVLLGPGVTAFPNRHSDPFSRIAWSSRPTHYVT